MGRQGSWPGAGPHSRVLGTGGRDQDHVGPGRRGWCPPGTAGPRTGAGVQALAAVQRCWARSSCPGAACLGSSCLALQRHTRNTVPCPAATCSRRTCQVHCHKPSLFSELLCSKEGGPWGLLSSRPSLRSGVRGAWQGGASGSVGALRGP